MSRAFGPYLLEEELGRGAMGVVFRARHSESRALVALKILTGSPDPETVERLQREARIAGRLEHPGAVGIQETGVLEGRPYAVMELVTGETFAALLDRGTLDRERALALVREVALVLAHAHERGVVHRDLKPANVMVDTEGRARVLDFGLSIATGERRLTETGLVVGTPSYLSPEQAKAERAPVGPPADVYALGGMIYRILTGRPPFQGDALALLKKVLVDRPVPPRTLDPTIPRALDDLVLRCLEKDPARRPRAVEVARALEQLGPAKDEARRAPIVVAGVLAVVLAGAAVAWSLRAPPAPPPAPPPPPPPAKHEAPAPVPTVVERSAKAAARDAEHAIEEDDLERARRYVREALAIDPNEPLAHAIRGFLLAESGRIPAARTEIDRAIQLDAALPEAYFYRARICDMLGNHEGAIPDLDEAIRLRPSWARFYIERGEHLADLGQREKALADLEKARSLEPGLRGVAELEGCIAFDDQDFARARDAFTREIEIDARYAPGWIFRSHCDRNLGDAASALADARKAVGLQPSDGLSRDALSWALEASGNPAEALVEAREAARLEPQNDKFREHLDALEAQAR